MTEATPPAAPSTDLLLYRTEDGRDRIEVRLHDETVWLTQAQMAELFETSVPNINQHLGHIYAEGELDPRATIQDYLIVRNEGSRQVSRRINHYSLEAILAVGYRVRSRRGTQFRQWATARLREYVVKGFAMDDERLKAGRNPGLDYFDELLERIRDIRASEKRFYQKIRDIYALAVDYDPKAEETRAFFQEVQNKLHFAVSGKTAAELIAERADASQPNMGLTTWKNAPAGPIRKADIGVAKNYLTHDEMVALNRVVTMYLDYAEDQAVRQRPMHMADWVRKLDAFLEFNERNILSHAGRVTAEIARQHAEQEFAKHEATLRIREAAEPTSDFDKAVERIKRLKQQPPTAKRPPSKPAKKATRKRPGRRGQSDES